MTPRSRNSRRRLVPLVLLVLIGVSAAVAVSVTWLLAGSRMSYDGTLIVAGIERPVTIRFDARARPYVRAETVADALFAQGFLHARERLWQMDLLRRAGSARLAELLGPDLVETDIALWRAGVPELAGRLAGGSSDGVVALVEAYTAGVNAGIDSLRQPPPEYLLAGIEPVPWRPADSFALGAIMAFDSAGNFEREILRYALAGEVTGERMAPFLPVTEVDPDFPYLWSPETAADEPPDAGLAVAPGRTGAAGALAFARAAAPDARPPGASVRFGSNGWVVSPARTVRDRALFAFDSHDALGLPNLFYEVHLFFGFGCQLRGWSVPGLPGVINGFNAQRAWGFTNIGDTQDLVALRPDPQRSGRYGHGQGSYTARRETTRIAVRGEDPVTVERWITPNGPVISDDPPLALRWVAQDLDEVGLDALLGINLALTHADFEAALTAFPAPAANITWADRDGHIGFRTIGRLPVRSRGNGLRPVADDGADIWNGRVPAASMPAKTDPPAGFAAAANARVHDANWPYLVSNDNAPGWRIRRIHRFLAAREDHDLASLAALQNDHYNVQAERDGARMRALLERAGPVGERKAVLAILDAWLAEPINRPGSAGALIFEAWYLALLERLFAPALSGELYGELLEHNYVLNQAVERLLEDPDSSWWRGDAAALVAAALADAVAGLEEVPGSEATDWRLDRRHVLTLRHEFAAAAPVLEPLLNRGPYPMGGGHATVGRAGYRYARPFAVSHAATVRVVLELGDPITGRAVIPGGQSGRFYSPHYDDQVEAWLAGDYFGLLAVPEDLEGRQLVLRPGGMHR